MGTQDRDVADRLAAGETISFAASPLKQAGIAGAGVAMVAVSAWLTRFDDALIRVVGWVGVAFFAVGVAAAAAAALRRGPDALTLTRDELVVTQGRHQHRLVWGEVAGSYLATIPAAANTKVAAIELVPGAAAQVTDPDGAPRRAGLDATSAYRRPDDSEPEGQLVMVPRGIAGLSQQQAAAMIDEVASALRDAP